LLATLTDRATKTRIAATVAKTLEQNRAPPLKVGAGKSILMSATLHGFILGLLWVRDDPSGKRPDKRDQAGVRWIC
jgi:hypothetical protein